uniref:Uncharacterized protein n=1 Tax=Streptomyces sp. NBC_00093 TaxID=2975649 RepID=A0AAU2ABU7_9ACTN
MTDERPVLATTPSSQSALHQQHLDQLATFLNTSERILAAWDAYSDQHTDPDGWPYDDDAYGRCASRRDADTALAFEPVREGAHQLLATAEVQLTVLPARAVQNRWVWQLGVLHDALDRLDALHDEWVQTLNGLPAEARPGTEVLDDALAVHHAEAWAYLDDWAAHGHAIRDIHTAARHAPSVLAPKPTTTAAPVPGRRSPARK